MRRRAFAQVFGGHIGGQESLLAGARATSFRANFGFPFSTTPLVSPFPQETDLHANGDTTQEPKITKSSSFVSDRTPLNRYYAQLASSAALITQLQQTWNLRTFNPYILQQSSLPFLTQKKTKKLNNCISPPNNSPSDQNINTDPCGSNSKLSTSQAENSKPSTSISPFFHCFPSAADLQSSSIAAGENKYTSESCTVPSKSLAQWFSRPPLSFYYSTPNQLGSPTHPLSRESLLHPFPFLQSNLAPTFKM